VVLFNAFRSPGTGASLVVVLRVIILQVRQAEVEAGRDHPWLVLREQGRLLIPT